MLTRASLPGPPRSTWSAVDNLRPVHPVLVTIIGAAVAYAGTMIDNFVAFAAQLSVTPRERHRRAVEGQVIGVASLVAIAATVGDVLRAVPRPLTALFAVAPWWLAARAWTERGRTADEVPARGAMTTFLVTLALGGDNLGVWIPLFRLDGVARGLIAVAVVALGEVVFVTAAGAIARHPRVVRGARRLTPRLIPFVYLALGAVIVIEALT